MVDPTTGEIRFGPAVRMEDGELRRFGAVPPRGALLRLGFYRTGGGAAGNVAAGTITALRTSIPYVASVYNREAARGGVDGETVDEARGRGPLELRRRNRAVTAEDFVTITLEAAPELARAHCVPITQGPDAGALRVLIVPRPPTGSRRAALKDLRLPAGARQRVVSALDRARLVGTRVIVEPPSYIGVRVDARVRARRGSDPVAVERDATQALFDYSAPTSGVRTGRAGHWAAPFRPTRCTPSWPGFRGWTTWRRWRCSGPIRGTNPSCRRSTGSISPRQTSC